MLMSLLTELRYDLFINYLYITNLKIKIMGLFGFIGEVASAAVKVAITPIAVIDDAFKLVTGSEPDTTKKLIKSAGKDLEKAVDEIMP